MGKSLRLARAITVGAFFCGASLSSQSDVYAFRTAGDLETFGETEKVRWATGTASFVVVDDIPSGVGSLEQTGDAIRRALGSWREVECSTFAAAYAGVTGASAQYGDRTNSIQWVSSGWEDLGFEQRAAGATDIRYEQEDGDWVIAEADIYLNAEHHAWTTGGGVDDKRELAGVLTHELGHALGLLHPCFETEEPMCTAEVNESPPTMHPAYSNGQVNLNSDDIAGICFLYPACSADTCDEGETCTEFGCVDICGSGICGTGERCVDGECVDPTEPCLFGDPECQQCKLDDECGEGFECVRETCVRLKLPLGDPCASDSDCESRKCVDAGFCGAACASDDQCGAEGACDVEARMCSLDERQPIGGACASADGCLGGHCLADLTDEPVCTRRCESEGVACPFDWSCGEAEGESICVPPAAEEEEPGCGCHSAGLERPDSTQNFFLALGALTLSLFLRRRRSPARAAGV